MNSFPPLLWGLYFLVFSPKECSQPLSIPLWTGWEMMHGACIWEHLDQGLQVWSYQQKAGAPCQCGQPVATHGGAEFKVVPTMQAVPRSWGIKERGELRQTTLSDLLWGLLNSGMSRRAGFPVTLSSNSLFCCFPNRVLKVSVGNLAFLVQLEFGESLVTG